VFNAVGDVAPDLDDPQQLRAAFEQIQQLNADGKLLAYHDRSDGGLFATLAEMAFAGHCGFEIALDGLSGDTSSALFNEELGFVVQLRAADAPRVVAALREAGLAAHDIGTVAAGDTLRFSRDGRIVLEASRSDWHRAWAETSHRIAALRDNPDCANEEFAALADADDPGLHVQLTFTPSAAPHIAKRPKVAILREQGVNGQYEMAYAFHAAGFDAVDVHMSDVLEGRVTLADFAGLAACGGFSYGDVLGAGQGWAKTILFNERGRAEFQTFLANPERFALGVCNGCQMFAALKDIVPGAEHWPAFRRNRSEQFEARWTQVELLESKSVLFAGMAGTRMPIAVSHGEGRAEFAGADDLAVLKSAGQTALRYVTTRGEIATRYPANPNGSPEGLASVCNTDGRVTIMMPHPERTIAGTSGSWWPQAYAAGGGIGKTPWFQMFVNARKFSK
jgi:phosphoribosylformylglycinamidine synthase